MSSLKVRVPLTVEVSRGAYTSDTAHTPPGLIVAQLFFAVTVATEDIRLLRWRIAFPQFVRWIVCVLDVLTITDPKFTFQESKHAEGAGVDMRRLATNPCRA